MTTAHYEQRKPEGGVPIKAWTRGVPVEDEARQQLAQHRARCRSSTSCVAVMPDVHLGIGATVGSVIPTQGAIIPAAVGVDIGCGMMAVRTTLRARATCPTTCAPLRSGDRAAVPHGRTDNGGTQRPRRVGRRRPPRSPTAWARARRPATTRIVAKHPQARRRPTTSTHLGTLGTGNHFIEVCLDEADRVWVMLHAGSRGVGNRIGTLLHRARQEGHARARRATCPTRTSRTSPEGTRALRRLRRGGRAGRRSSRARTAS